MTPDKPMTVSDDLKPWPFYGYAPGNYTGTCIGCDKVKEGLDKRAIRCLECAIFAAKAASCPSRDDVEEQIHKLIEDRLFPIFGAGPYEQLAKDVAALSSSIVGDDVERVAWQFELARCIDHSTVPPTYCDWGPPQLSFSEPHVPEGSVRNLTSLYTLPKSTGERP
jgi:hypothetical protein